MYEKNLVLIGDNSLSFAIAYSVQLENLGIQTIKVEKDVSRIFEAIWANRPQVIVLDTMIDVLTLVDRICDIDGYKPTIILLECYEQETEVTPLLVEKIDLYVKHPVEMCKLCDKIVKIVSPTNVDSVLMSDNNESKSFIDLSPLEYDLEVVVTETILLLGIPAHVKGYQYIRSAVINCIETPNMLNSVTQTLYPTIAKEFDTSTISVERAIRHAIELAWGRGLNNFFGHTDSLQQNKPTNSEFIARVSDELRLKHKHILNQDKKTEL